MREIKFRAWDKERKEMLPVKLIDWAEWWVSCDPTYGKAKPLEYGERNSFKNEQTDRHILMQYTGLKDKNGIEIYEGDILSTDIDRNYLIVEFKNGAFVFQCYDDGKDYYELMLPISSDTDTYKYGEIIGNIYEKPELVGDHS